MHASESQSGQPLDRLIAVGVAFLLAAFAFTALGPGVAGASQSDEAVGKRYDDADDVVTVDDDDDDADPDELRDGNSGTTKGTGKSRSKSNTNDNSAGTNDNSRGSGNGGGGGGTGTGNSGGT